MAVWSVVALLLLTGGSRTTQGQAAVIQGTVVADDLAGALLADVEISTPSGARTRTNASGEFSIEILDAGPGDSVTLELRKEGYVLVSRLQAEITLTDRPQPAVVFVMCAEGRRAQMLRRYYRTKAFSELERTLARRRAEIPKARATKVNLGRVEDRVARARAIIEWTSTLMARYDRLEASASNDLLQAARLFVSGDMDGALDRLNGRIRSREQAAHASGDDDDRLAAMLLKGQILTARLEMEEAGRTFESAAATFPTSTHAQFALAAFNTGVENLAAARNAYLKVLTMASHDEEIAVTQSTLGAILGPRDEAVAAFDKALAIFRTLAEKQPDLYVTEVVDMLNRKGRRSFDEKHFEQGDTAFRDALAFIRQHDDASYSLDRARTRKNQAMFFYYQHERQDAREALDDAYRDLSARARVMPETYTLDVAETLYIASLLARDQERFDDAGRWAQESLRLYGRFSGAGSVTHGFEILELEQLVASLPAPPPAQVEKLEPCAEPRYQFLEALQKEAYDANPDSLLALQRNRAIMRTIQERTPHALAARAAANAPVGTSFVGTPPNRDAEIAREISNRIQAAESTTMPTCYEDPVAYLGIKRHLALVTKAAAVMQPPIPVVPSIQYGSLPNAEINAYTHRESETAPPVIVFNNGLVEFIAAMAKLATSSLPYDWLLTMDADADMTQEKLQLLRRELEPSDRTQMASSLRARHRLVADQKRLLLAFVHAPGGDKSPVTMAAADDLVVPLGEGMLTFSVGHEYAHAALKHQPAQAREGIVSWNWAQELEADRHGVRLMTRALSELASGPRSRDKSVLTMRGADLLMLCLQMVDELKAIRANAGGRSEATERAKAILRRFADGQALTDEELAVAGPIGSHPPAWLRRERIQAEIDSLLGKQRASAWASLYGALATQAIDNISVLWTISREEIRERLDESRPRQ